MTDHTPPKWGLTPQEAYAYAFAAFAVLRRAVLDEIHKPQNGEHIIRTSAYAEGVLSAQLGFTPKQMRTHLLQAAEESRIGKGTGEGKQPRP